MLAKIEGINLVLDFSETLNIIASCRTYDTKWPLKVSTVSKDLKKTRLEQSHVIFIDNFTGNCGMKAFSYLSTGAVMINGSWKEFDQDIFEKFWFYVENYVLFFLLSGVLVGSHNPRGCEIYEKIKGMQFSEKMENTNYPWKQGNSNHFIKICWKIIDVEKHKEAGNLWAY